MFSERIRHRYELYGILKVGRVNKKNRKYSLITVYYVVWVYVITNEKSF